MPSSVPQDLSALQCEVCVLVFSVTDRRSFHRTAQLRLLLRETQPQTPIILVGNKSDLVRTREVTSEGKRSLLLAIFFFLIHFLWLWQLILTTCEAIFSSLSVSVKHQRGVKSVKKKKVSILASSQCGSMRGATITVTGRALPAHIHALPAHIHAVLQHTGCNHVLLQPSCGVRANLKTLKTSNR